MRKLFNVTKELSSHKSNTPLVETLTDFRDPRISEIVDVRTPSEFEIDHIPGAINLPVLDNQERVEVGTLYTMNSFEARKTGAADVTKNISKHISDYFQTKPQEYSPLIYCWRGGQRSSSMAIVLSEIGFQTFVLQGGYKAYRRGLQKNLETLPCQFKYKIISGLTGTGKTKILDALHCHGEQVLDLEMLAKHKGSVLGLWHGETQPSQKYWESLLSEELTKFDSSRIVWMESESRKIGKVSVPQALFEMLCKSPRININLPLEERVKHILNDYPNWLENTDHLKDTIKKLVRVQGHAQVEKWLDLIDKGKMDEFVESVLINHYDPTYTLSQKKNSHLGEISDSLDIPNLEKETLNNLVSTLKSV